MSNSCNFSLELTGLQALKAVLKMLKMVHRRLYPDDRSIVMEIQSLVKAGKMQRIKSTAMLKTAKSATPAPGLLRSRTVSVNCGASACS
jgi:hypothetical protein